jgi:LuxR family maltose regulon positive regulatory protein
MTHTAALRPAPGGAALGPPPPLLGDAGLVAAKLSRPELPPGYVDRPRLRAALDAGTRSPVTLVTGGPGWGKTLQVAAWAAAAASTRTVCWLTLDDDDDEPRAFWAYLLAALRRSGAVRPDNALASLDPRAGLNPESQRQVQVGLSQLPHEVVLVLDDVSEIRSDEVFEQIARLFRHGSPLRLVLVCRADPPLPLHRLRVSGDLCEIRTDDLGFTAAEATELLVGQGPGIDPTEVTQLLDRTDGWAAGLRLAAMFLRRPGVRAAEFSGADRSVADYLLSEVVAGQPPQTWQFLLRTSLVSRISGDLADTLTGQGHGQRTLDLLERDNAFVTALGPERRWYRYHPLLSEMLRRQLELERPDTVRGLHERAARWYAAHGQPVDAVRHAVQAGNWSLAGSTMTRSAVTRLQTIERRALAAALEQIPAAELGATPELQLCAAALSTASDRYGPIGPHLEAARAMLEHDPEPDPSTVVALCMFEGALARVRGAAAQVLAVADEALTTLDRHHGAIPLASEYRAIALNTRGVGLLWAGDTDAATTALQAGKAASEAAGVELTLVNDLGYLGLAAAVTGRLAVAEEWSSRCLALADARGWGDLLQAGAGYLAGALVAVARHDLDAADRWLALGMRTQRRDTEPLLRLGLRAARAAVDAARGRHEAAGSELVSIRSELETLGEAPLAHRWLAGTEAEVALARGAHADLRRRLESLDRTQRSADETLQLARALLADGDADAADRLLEPLARAGAELPVAVQCTVVRALCADRLRRDNEALALLDQALAQAAQERLLAPFHAAGTARLPGLLERVVLLRTVHSGFARTLLETMGAADATTGDDGLVEQVTEREKTVLRYLATMLSNAEIAEQMFLSPNTVKVHLRHVYRKLDVTSRRAAVRRARELHLLDGDDQA